MTSEVIIPSKYVLTKDEEIGIFPGVAYKLANKQVKNELLWGSNKFLAVQMAGQMNEEMIFTISHVFVERYINKCLDRTIDNVEIFRFYLSRGDFPERPTDIQGETVRCFKDENGRDVWTTYEHISGPYIADPQYIVSAFTAGRTEDISPVITESLIYDKMAYQRNPVDLPILGVVIEDDDIAKDQKYFEDMLLRTKAKKPIFVN